MEILQAKGEGLGTCINCEKNGIWNRYWMCFLYKIEGLPGLYCYKCTKELLKRKEIKD